MYIVKELTDDLVPLVDEFLHEEPFLNAYAIWDLHYQRNRTKFFACIEGGKLTGLLLDYFGHTGVHFIWLWGEERAVKGLLRILLPDKVVFYISPEFEGLVRERFAITAKYPVDFMLLEKGSEHIIQRHEIKPLNLNHAYPLAGLRKESPTNEEVEQAKSFIREQPFYGIFKNGQLISVACIHAKIPEVWMIGGFIQSQNTEIRGVQHH